MQDNAAEEENSNFVGIGSGTGTAPWYQRHANNMAWWARNKSPPIVFLTLVQSFKTPDFERRSIPDVPWERRPLLPALIFNAKRKHLWKYLYKNPNPRAIGPLR